MNNIDFSPRSPMEENNIGSDSESNPDEDSSDYYQPISAVDLDNDEDGSDEEDYSLPVNGGDHHHGTISNGHRTLQEAREGISSIDLNGCADQKSESEADEDETERETPGSAIRRAHREDEHRRNSPLTAENAARVMDAMRAISFPGTAPDWASQVPEDSWINHLQRLRSTTEN